MTAKPAIWMPFYVGDYLADTGHLCTWEHGAYLLLLAHYWRTGKPLADDAETLARIARAAPDEWARHEATIRALFLPQGGKLAHKRVEAELAKARANIESLSKRGKRGAEKRWNSQGIAEPCNSHQSVNAQAMAGDAPSPSPSPSVSKETAAGPHGIAGAKAAIFRQGLAYLSRNGVPEKQARTLLGKWRGVAGDGAVLDMLGKAEAEGVSEPVAWIERALKPKARFNEAVI